jgi:excisionase family DNA binding protein
MAHALADPIVPTHEDAARAKAAQIALERSAANGAALNVHFSATGKEATFELPPLVTEMLKEILKATAAGKAVSLVPVDAEISTQQAATLLNVSRPFVVGLVEKGILSARMVGNQRRLPLQEVLDFKAENRAQRRATLAKLAAHDQALGLE